MNEHAFIQTLNMKAKECGINPLLLLSGIEGIYTFREVQLNAINFVYLDSLILTIFALRIGDQFHTIAEENLKHSNSSVRLAAINELNIFTDEEIAGSSNDYLKSFASMVNGKSPIRKYHEKALEVAALEIKRAQVRFSNNSIGHIVITICKEDPTDSLGLSFLFGKE